MTGHAAVVGSGVMGADIALSLALGGLTVNLWGRRESGVDEALTRIRNGALGLASEGIVASAEVTMAVGRIAGTANLATATAGARFVIEAVSEDLELKREVLHRVEDVAAIDAILASTTSGLSASSLADGLRDPGRFVVAHYAQPAHLVEVVEVVPGEHTSESTVCFVEDLLRSSGKLPIRVADIPGFAWSRIQLAILRELVSLVQRGAVSVEACDTLMKRGYGSRLPAMGPFEHADLAGIGLTRAVARIVWPDLANFTVTEGTLIDELWESGRLGMAAGRGFYDWTANDPTEFKRARDREISNRLKLNRGGQVVFAASSTPDDGHRAEFSDHQGANR